MFIFWCWLGPLPFQSPPPRRSSTSVKECTYAWSGGRFLTRAPYSLMLASVFDLCDKQCGSQTPAPQNRKLQDTLWAVRILVLKYRVRDTVHTCTGLTSVRLGHHCGKRFFKKRKENSPRSLLNSSLPPPPSAPKKYNGKAEGLFKETWIKSALRLNILSSR
jgi:hypothetical protein